MAKNKPKEKKKHLVREKRVNKRAPVWIYLKTKKRDLIRGRKRHWRSGKIGKKIKKKMKRAKTKTQKKRTGTRIRKIKK